MKGHDMQGKVFSKPFRQNGRNLKTLKKSKIAEKRISISLNLKMCFKIYRNMEKI